MYPDESYKLDIADVRCRVGRIWPRQSAAIPQEERKSKQTGTNNPRQDSKIPALPPEDCLRLGETTRVILRPSPSPYPNKPHCTFGKSKEGRTQGGPQRAQGTVHTRRVQGTKRAIHLFVRNMRQGRGWGTRPEALEARPVHSDLGNRAVHQPRLWII